MGDVEPLRWPQQEESPPVLKIEQALVGALMMNPARALAKLPASFSPEHYLDDLHRSIHELIVETGDGSPLTVAQRLGGSQEDRKYVAELITAAVGYISAGQFAEAVTDAFYRREAVAVAEEMLERAKMGTREMPSGMIVQASLARLDALLCGSSGTSIGVSLNQAMDTAIESTQAAFRGEGLTGRLVGLKSIDRALKGLENGTFNILAGRPGAGKSALGAQFAVNIARSAKAETEAGAERAGVVMFSLEMKAQAIGRRALAACAQIGIQDLRAGKIEGRENTLMRARRELDSLPFWIEDAGGQNLVAIRQKCRSAIRRFGKLALIVVDHLHIVKPDEVDRRHGGTQAIGRISNTLRDMSKEFDCPVLALAQLSRGLLSRDDKRPNLGDLRQAGDIEQDADTVSFVHREEMYIPKSEPTQDFLGGETIDQYQKRLRQWDEARIQAKGKADFIIEKLREGDPATIALRWHGSTTCFSDPEDGPPEPPVQGDLTGWHDSYFDQSAP